MAFNSGRRSAVRRLSAFLTARKASPHPARLCHVRPWLGGHHASPHVRRHHQVTPVAFSPFGSGAAGQLLSDPALQRMAATKHVSTAQLVLAWNLQRGPPRTTLQSSTSMPRLVAKARGQGSYRPRGRCRLARPVPLGPCPLARAPSQRLFGVLTCGACWRSRSRGHPAQPRSDGDPAESGGSRRRWRGRGGADGRRDGCGCAA